MITVMWQEDDQAAETFTIPDSMLASFEQYRAAQLVGRAQRIPDGQGGFIDQHTLGPQHASIREMVVSHFVETLVKPALTKFPPADVATLAAAAEAAGKALKQAQEAAFTSFIAPAQPAKESPPGPDVG